MIEAIFLLSIGGTLTTCTVYAMKAVYYFRRVEKLQRTGALKYGKKGRAFGQGAKIRKLRRIKHERREQLKSEYLTGG